MKRKHEVYALWRHSTSLCPKRQPGTLVLPDTLNDRAECQSVTVVMAPMDSAAWAPQQSCITCQQA